jgi:transposase-like protein
MKCKQCKTEEIIKSGIVRGKQRYHSKSCGYNFVEGDGCIKESTALKKALAVLLYGMVKSSFRSIARVFDVSVSQVYGWVVIEGKKMREAEVSAELKEIEIDEMWHFVKSKKTKNGYSKPWSVVQGEPLPGLSVVVMLQRYEGCTKN